MIQVYHAKGALFHWGFLSFSSPLKKVITFFRSPNFFSECKRGSVSAANLIDGLAFLSQGV